MSESDPVAQAMDKVVPPFFKGIPSELHDLRQFLLWRYEANDKGDVTKIPYNARNGKRASSTDTTTWSYLNEVQTRYEKEAGEWAGIGLALVGSLVAIDFDKVYNNGVVENPYANFMKHLHTYFELSPSGRGVRGFLFGRLPRSRTRSPRNNWRIELYETARYVSLTGRKLPNNPLTIRKDQPLLDSWYNHLFPLTEEKPKEVVSVRDESVNGIIEQALKSKSSAKFSAFMRGDWQAAGNYPSKSESDLAFAMMIAWWVDGDPHKIRSIFEQSQMADAKWKRSDYSEATIKKAIALYTPRQ